MKHPPQRHEKGTKHPSDPRKKNHTHQQPKLVLAEEPKNNAPKTTHTDPPTGRQAQPPLKRHRSEPNELPLGRHTPTRRRTNKPSASTIAPSRCTSASTQRRPATDSNKPPRSTHHRQSQLTLKPASQRKPRHLKPLPASTRTPSPDVTWCLRCNRATPCTHHPGDQKDTRRALGYPGLEKAHEREKHTS